MSAGCSGARTRRTTRRASRATGCATSCCPALRSLHPAAEANVAADAGDAARRGGGARRAGRRARGARPRRGSRALPPRAARGSCRCRWRRRRRSARGCDEILALAARARRRSTSAAACARSSSTGGCGSTHGTGAAPPGRGRAAVPGQRRLRRRAAGEPRTAPDGDGARRRRARRAARGAAVAGRRPHAPARAGGTRTLQDLFTDRKVPRERRAHVPVVVSGGEIAWVRGRGHRESGSACRRRPTAARARAAGLAPA